MTSPQRSRHGRLVTGLTTALTDRAFRGVGTEREMTVRLDARNRPEPDLLATSAPYDPDRTWYAPEDVLLVVEVVSPESAHRDRTVKLRKYAEAGIPHYWCVEEENGVPVAHVHELDGPTGAYAAAGIFRGALQRPLPFDLDLDLAGFLPRRRA
ncbi:hypothetical protein GCM10007079_42230 [Nocardiopsis terrae]|uniref:Uma2 family endonuclease n=1 Tax=Nocardiopsis terrae TaxID=372655 RepID=A0ABR9HLR9_9ACTN|nr:Uma2 family endonuclease [Nocardiopsis terrae]MBE1459961.1 Uma2 family endonuclease [Nocardiopsis terrae]GHC93136.1 hypothetical protein GCM10007079_42230 [Nocardiopsis terrae]